MTASTRAPAASTAAAWTRNLLLRPVPVGLLLLYLMIGSAHGLLLDQKELEELERYSRNANHHDHGHHHEHGHEASEDIFDRAARVGIRVFDGKDREGADDLGNDLELIGGHSHANHAAELEKLRELLNSGLSLGELFSTGLVRTTTPKSVITVSTVRLPIKDHAHWQDTPTELVVHDNVAEPVFKTAKSDDAQEFTLANNHHPPFEYLTETPYYSNEDDIVNSTATSNTVAKAHETPNEPFAETHTEEHKPIIINDRGINYPQYGGIEEEYGALEYGEDYYYDGDNQEDYYQYDYDDSIFDESFNGSGLTRTPRTPRSFDNPKTRAIGRKILSAGPAHLTMSNKDMDHMMMMFLHNAVTQVEMEDQDLNQGSSNPRSNKARQRPQSRPQRPKSRPKSKSKVKEATSPARRPKVFGGELEPPPLQPEQPAAPAARPARPSSRPTSSPKSRPISRPTSRPVQTGRSRQERPRQQRLRDEQRLRQEQTRKAEEQRKADAQRQREAQRIDEERRREQQEEQRRRQKKLDEERRLREEKKRQKQEQERLEQQKRIQEQEQRRVQEQVRRQEEDRRQQARRNEEVRRQKAFDEQDRIKQDQLKEQDKIRSAPYGLQLE